MSRTPVREAMRKLEQEGLVVMIPPGCTGDQHHRKDLSDVLEIAYRPPENVAIEKRAS